MKKSFLAGIMFLAAAATFSLALAQTGLQYAILTSSGGELVGQVDPSWVNNTEGGSSIAVAVVTYTNMPAGVPASSLAPAVTSSPKTVNVTVPASSPVAFCTGGNFYNKATGKCADGKFPYKIVPLNSLKDPAAQTANVVCREPMVPTWNPAMKKWNCIVPTGFKLSLGE